MGSTRGPPAQRGGRCTDDVWHNLWHGQCLATRLHLFVLAASFPMVCGFVLRDATSPVHHIHFTLLFVCTLKTGKSNRRERAKNQYSYKEKLSTRNIRRKDGSIVKNRREDGQISADNHGFS